MPAVWTGSGGDGLWSNTANWDTGNVPDTAGETAEFDGAAGGTVNVDGNFTIDALTFTNTAGSWLLDGNGTLTISNGGTLNQLNAGTNQIAARLSATSLVATVAAGSLELSNTTDGALNSIDGASVFHITGGRLIVTAESAPGSQRNPLGAATVQFDTNPGGVFQVRAKAISSHVDFLNPINVLQSGTVELSGSAATGDFDLNRNIQIAAGQTLTFNVTQQQLHVHATISGDGNILKTGTGLLVFDHSNTYTGTTTIREGQLAAGQTVNPVPLGATTGATVVENGATLAIRASTNYVQPEPLFLTGTGNDGNAALSTQGGNNTFAGPITLTGDTSFGAQGGETLTVTGFIGTQGGLHDLTVNARVTVAGDFAVGALNVAGGTINGNGTGTAILDAGAGASFDAASTFVVDLNGATPGSGHDQLAVTGTVALGGTLTVRRGGALPAVGDRFTIISNDGSDSVTGIFLGRPEGSTVTSTDGIVTYRISYVGGDGNDVVLTVQSVLLGAVRFRDLDNPKGSQEVFLGAFDLGQPAAPGMNGRADTGLTWNTGQDYSIKFSYLPASTQLQVAVTASDMNPTPLTYTLSGPLMGADSIKILIRVQNTDGVTNEIQLNNVTVDGVPLGPGLFVATGPSSGASFVEFTFANDSLNDGFVFEATLRFTGNFANSNNDTNRVEIQVGRGFYQPPPEPVSTAVDGLPLGSSIPVSQVNDPTLPPPAATPPTEGGNSLPQTPPPASSGGSDGPSAGSAGEGSTGAGGGGDGAAEPVGSNTPEGVPAPPEVIPIQPPAVPTTEPRAATATKPTTPHNQRPNNQPAARFDFTFWRQELDEQTGGGGGGMEGVRAVTEVATGVTAASLVLTVGYLALFGRNAILVWTAMINLPMWRELDPLAVLEFWEKKGKGARAEQAVGELFDG